MLSARSFLITGFFKIILYVIVIIYKIFIKEE